MTDTAATPVLELDRVAKHFPSGDTELLVLDDVSLVVEPGALCALVGRSGSGKTTLLTIAIGWERADHGHVRWCGAPCDMAALPWSEVAVVPQALGLLEELTVGENIRLPARLDAGADPGLVDELMDQLSIDHLADRYPSEVSLGEQQRAAVARALVLRPRLVLADEPVAHQNDEFIEVILNRFEALTDAGSACLVATHNLEVLARMTKVVELHGGRLSAPVEAADVAAEPVPPEPAAADDPDDSMWAPP